MSLAFKAVLFSIRSVIAAATSVSSGSRRLTEAAASSASSAGHSHPASAATARSSRRSALVEEFDVAMLHVLTVFAHRLTSVGVAEKIIIKFVDSVTVHLLLRLSLVVIN